jgi:hypothetical protein
VNHPLFTTRRERIIALAARYAVPTMYVQREFASAGGLVTYGTDLPEVYRLTGGYAGRILKGDKPADLPVLLPTKFEMIINLRTAKALGLDVPDKLLALADVKRREFITLLGGAAVTWPFKARAQQPAMPVVGFLRSTPATGFAYCRSLSAGPNDAGFVEGKNVAIEFTLIASSRARSRPTFRCSCRPSSSS